MSMKLRLMLACVISIVPGNFLRVQLYRLALGYRITGASIGWRTVIAVKDCTLDRCLLGRNNLFYEPMSMRIGAGANMGHRNQFICGEWAKDDQYARRLVIGAGCLVTSEHYFDVAGAFDLGDGSWIGGCRSQFWTHGPGADDRDISIGQRCYLGSGVMFAPGAAIGDNTIVAMGSVVTRTFAERDVMVAGQPARVVRTQYDWKTKQRVALMTA
jgi:acetyltransferase-like isoleucine patch superfamily enzyme